MMHFVTGEILAIYEKDGLTMGRIRVGGAVTRASLVLLSHPRVGDRVLIHAGVALSKVRPEAPSSNLPSNRSRRSIAGR